MPRRLDRLQLLEHVVHLRQRERGMLLLSRFAERIVLLGDGADFLLSASPDGAKRNLGLIRTGDQDPDCAALHPGYACYDGPLHNKDGPIHVQRYGRERWPGLRARGDGGGSARAQPAVCWPCA